MQPHAAQKPSSVSLVHLLAVPNADGHGVASAQEAVYNRTGRECERGPGSPSLSLSTCEIRTDRSVGSILGPALLSRLLYSDIDRCLPRRSSQTGQVALKRSWKRSE